MAAVTDKLKQLIRTYARPMLPQPAGTEPQLCIPAGLKAVLFDIYGTLLISGTGDISLTSKNSISLNRLLESNGCQLTPDSSITASVLKKNIEKRHTELKNQGITYPEVEIRNIWSSGLSQLHKAGELITDPAKINTEHIALEYELTVNPVWPMPGFPKIISQLRQADFRIGIVSNAQFYTPLILETFIEKPLKSIGFSPDLCAWSYKLSCSKPSPDIFNGPLNALASEGISPPEVLYVGNDMLNDVTAASQAGCRTALFAGDRRSLRLRENDSRVTAKPDMIVTELSQLTALCTDKE